MPRAHVEFIQSQALPWTPSPWPCLAGCQAKLLSRDLETGAASAVVRVGAGWGRPMPGWIDARLELFVLEGALDVNGRRYEQDCYASLPAGYPYRGCRSEDGAVVLAFFDGEPVWHDGPPPPGEHDLSDAIEFLDAYEMPWAREGMDPAYADLGMQWKLLRGSPLGADATMLVACPPHLHPQGWRGPQEVHDCVEEMFLLSGDYQSNVGLMSHGAYFWRPPGVAHGPYGSRGGSLALIRTQGAALENHWTVHEVPISRAPAYAPALPGHLEAYRHRPWRPQRY